MQLKGFERFRLSTQLMIASLPVIGLFTMLIICNIYLVTFS
jgi:hypothetical protein